MPKDTGRRRGGGVENLHSLPLGELETALHGAWDASERHEKTGHAAPIADSELRQVPALGPAESPASKAWGIYLGRRVLSKSLGYMVGRWGAAAEAMGLDFYPTRQPLGVRYLGFRTLTDLKIFSKAASSGEPIEAQNPNIRVIGHFEQLLSDPLAKEEIDATFVASSLRLQGEEVISREYGQPDEGTSVVLGMRLTNLYAAAPGEDPVGDLRDERNYYLDFYDPNFYGRLPSRAPYIPMGWIRDIAVADPRVSELMETCQHVGKPTIVLGALGLTREMAWAAPPVR
ncbi:MAG TPA: hypothetical protein VF466_02385 [Candidatus Saccharimonadales bacterium]